MTHPHFIEPRYQSACFVDVPNTIRALLSGQTRIPLSDEVFGPLTRPFKHAVCFFIDALGWRFIEPRLDDYPFLKSIAGRGLIQKITSQFPSTTSAHMTAFHTGLSPAKSGIYEWRFFEPTLDEMISPLIFSYSGDHTRGTLARDGVDPAAIFPAQTFYPALKTAGINSTIYFPSDISHSPYSQHIGQGATLRGYKTFSQGLVNVAEQIKAADAPTYINLYYPGIDTVCHRHGPDSPQVHAEIDMVLTALERAFLALTRDRCPETLFIVTADHGQVDISPERTTYLNLDPRFEGLQAMMKTNRRGAALVPGGSPRDMFLYIEPTHLEEAHQMLRTGLEGVAEVERVEDLIGRGYFGKGECSESFRARIADLVVLPYAFEAVWWYEEGRFEQHHYGHHGGLTPAEMEIPLLACDLSP